MTQGAAPRGMYFPDSHRRPIQHGTIGGYRAHYRHGEPMCEPCRHAERMRHGYAAPQRTAQCGTRSGYNRHRRLREQVCDDCRAAAAEAKNERDRQLRGDQWTYDRLVPVVAELAAQGLTLTEIAEALGVSKLRAGRARARAERGAT